MDLRLELTRPGRRPSPLSAEVTGPLQMNDLGMLASQGVQAPELKKITERHHSLARLLASGIGEGEAAAITGLTGNRVSILKASPAFKELLDLYRDSATAQYAEMHGRLAGMATDAIVEIQDRLEDKPEEIGLGQLIEIAKLGADRTGFGPSSKQEVNLNVNLSERLEAARQRARALKDITPKDEE